MNRLAIVAAGVLLAGMSSSAWASSVTFGQFTQKQATRVFRYKNLDSGINKAAEIYTTTPALSGPTANAHASIPVYYILSGGSLPLDLQGAQDAALSADFFATSGTTGSGSSRVQMFATGSITITRTTAALEGLNTRTNLLTVTFTNAELDASQNNGSFTFKSNSNSAITYTSDFMNFSNVLTKDFSLSFSGANPKFNAPLGSSSVNTRFSGTGTFASDPAPITIGVPEASTWAMLMIGFGVVGAALRTGRRSKDLFAA